MKKRFLTFIFTITAMLMCIFGLSACGTVEFKVNFMVDGEVYATLNTNGKEVIQLPENPTRENFSFEGWFWDKDVWEKPFTINSLLDAPLSSDMSVYAKFSLNTIDGVSFENVETTYDGREKTIAVSNLPNGANVVYDKENTYTNAGEYTVTATISRDNYEDLQLTATLTIEKRELTLAFSGETTLVYNGNVQKTVSAQATNVVGNDSVELTVTYNGEMIEAGDYIATVTLTEHENYKLTQNNTVQVTITRATHKVTFRQSGYTDVVREVLDLAELTDIPTPQNENGYTVTWNRTEFKTVTQDILVEAVKAPIEYDINYVLNGGVNNERNPSKYTVESGDITLESPTTDRFGSAFAGWYTTESFTDESNITVIEKGSYGGVTLYAKWIDYRVENAEGFTIDYTQETPKISKTVHYVTMEIDLKEIITVSEGCTWQISGDKYGTLVYTRKIIPLEIGNNEFYLSVFHPNVNDDALYELHVYRLDMKEYLFIDGLAEYASGTVQEESELNAPEINPEKDGYYFAGWAVDGQAVTFPYVVTKNVTFVATYLAHENTLKFNGNGATGGETPEMKIHTDETTTLTTNGFVKAGYTFIGWSLTENGEKAYNDKASYTMGTNTEYTLYAVWQSNENTLKFNGNGATGGVTPDMKIHADETKTLTTNGFVKAGYTFIGWSLTENGEKAYNDKASYTMGTNAEYTLYALWQANENTSYIVEYYLQNLHDDKYTLETTENLTGTTDTTATAEIKMFTHFTYQAGSTDNGNINGDGSTVLKVYYTRDMYTVTFDGNGGTLVSGADNQTVKYGGSVTAPEYLKTGYTFNGYDETNFTNISGNFTATAIYTINQYTLTIVYGNGQENVVITQVYNTPIESIVNPERAGYSFIGWDKTIPTNMPAENLTATAIWNAIFTLSENMITGLTDYGKNNYTELVIPTAIDGVTITSIGSYAFYNCSTLTSVIIPDSVTSIAEYAFAGCSLTNVTIPNSVTSIGSYAFAYCGSLTSVIIGNGVTSIGSSAFYNCNKLTSLIIPNGVKSIEDEAFAYCTSLTRVTIPDSVTSIGNWVFTSCGLTSMSIPDSVTNIGSSVFYNCLKLTSVTIGNNVTSISSSAFAYCSSLTSVTIPNCVTNIGNDAFRYCSSLTSVTIGNGVTSIGSSAFEDCSSLTSVYITDIASWCKISCDNTYANPLYYAHVLYLNNEIIKEITAEDLQGVTSIGSHAFYNCSSLTRITIPNSVTSIDSYAFAYCTSLTSVTIGNSVTNIGSSAFAYCGSLTSVIIGNGVTSIGSSAFKDCSSLTSVTIPNSVTSIGSSAFYGCSSLTVIYYNSTECADLNSSNHVFSNAGKNTTGITVTIGANVRKIPAFLFWQHSSSGYTPKITSVVFEEESLCESIGSSAFYNCSSLTSVTIPSSVTSIGSSAFYGCFKLIEVKNLSTLAITKGSSSFGYVGYYAKRVYKEGASYLSADENGYKIYDDGTDKILVGYTGTETDLTLPSGITQLYKYAFYNCDSITSVIIPDSVMSIGDRAFYECSSLTSVTIGNSVTGIGHYAFSDCGSLTSITIPNSVTSIGSSVFNNCSKLTSVTIGNGVESIGYSAFRGCSSLTSITIPNSVTNIGDEAFRDCSSLTSITIPNSVTSIGSFAFSGCSSLTSVTIGNGVENIGSSAFRGCNSLTSITFSDTSTWYRTTSTTEWKNKSGGTEISVTDSNQNATYFKSTYYNYYWYKL